MIRESFEKETKATRSILMVLDKLNADSRIRVMRNVVEMEDEVINGKQDEPCCEVMESC